MFIGRLYIFIPFNWPNKVERFRKNLATQHAPGNQFHRPFWQKYNKEKKKEKDMTYGHLTKANLTLNSILPLVSPIVE